MKKLISLLLVLCMASSWLLACSESKQNTDESDTAAAADPSAPSAEGAEAVAETEEIKPDIPDLDFGGEDFTVITAGANDDCGSDWVTYDVFVEEITGDVINDAVYERNDYLMGTYNIVFGEYKTNNTVRGDLVTDIKAGGGSYDAGFTGIMRCQTLGIDGYVYNMYDMPYINLEKPWWDHRLTEDCSLYGDVYLGTGDITVIDNDATWILMFNKKLHADYQLDDIYTLVREDRWYYDTLYEMLKVATLDLDGDGKLKPQIDQFGFVTTANTCYGLLYASGEQLAPKNAEGIPTLITDLDRVTRVVEKAGMILGDLDNVFVSDRTSYGTDDLRYIFEEGRALFYGEVAQCIIRMRNSETEFGVIPWPKFDEGQSRFYNFVHNTAAKAVVIPVSQNNTEMAGAIIEVMAAKSMTTLTVAYYDTALTYKYMRDQESSEMMDIILSSRCYDPAYINEWGSFSGTVFNVIYGGGTGLASAWQRSIKLFGKSRDKALEKLEKLQAQRAG